jgi:hypothetical protein
MMDGLPAQTVATDGNSLFRSLSIPVGGGRYNRLRNNGVQVYVVSDNESQIVQPPAANAGQVYTEQGVSVLNKVYLFFVQTGSGARPVSCTMGTGGPFSGGKARLGRDADHPPPSSAEVVNE